MKPRTRTNVADALLGLSLFGGLVAYLSGGLWPIEYSFSLIGLSFAGLVLGAVIRPPFWWGIRTFTTPVTDPSHEAKANEAPVVASAEALRTSASVSRSANSKYGDNEI